ncbi:MAG: TlpA family protein disulfide reductase [Solirubrobacterales bacterium]|nr:TlpA family protein disulfide reductase [Solirubrobacterales bacterium]
MKRSIVSVLVSLAGAALVALLVYGVSAQSASRTLDDELAHHRDPVAPEANRALPPLQGGHSVSLASYRGQVVLLNFWASWCVPCQQEAPLLERAQRQLQPHHATVLGVTFRDTTPDSLRFVHHYALTYPSLRDVTGEFTSSYGTEALPESFLIDRAGRIVMISRGEIDERFLQRALALAQSA